MTRFLLHPITENAPHPKQVLPKLRLPDASKPNPKLALIDWQQSPAPAQERLLSIDRLQINYIFNFQGVPADHHNVPVHGCEINLAVADQSVVGSLDTNINALAPVR